MIFRHGLPAHTDQAGISLSTTERALQDFANGKLAAFKVPKKIVILEEIPKGATGKLQRIGLAQKLGLG